MRYRFLTSHSIESDDEQHEFTIGEIPIVLKTRESNVKLKDTKDYLMLSSGINSEKKALELGVYIKKILRLAPVFANIGINVGNDKSTSAWSDEVKKSILQKTGKQLHDNVHGLSVYPEFPPPSFLNFKGDLSVSTPLSDFMKGVLEATLEDFISDDMEIPIDLYNACKMETSSAAKFILALNVIEKLSEQTERPNKELDTLNECMNCIDKMEGDDSSKNSIRNILGNSKRISVGHACRNLISCYLPEHLDEFKTLSIFRGKIAHPSKINERGELPDMAHRAEKLAGEIIKKIITPKKEAATSISVHSVP